MERFEISLHLTKILRSVDYGYKSILLTLAKNCGFAFLNFPTMIFKKKMADTGCSGPPFVLLNSGAYRNNCEKEDSGAYVVLLFCLGFRGGG